MSRTIKTFRRSLAGVLLVAASGCAGGQSGSEGELPAPPCPFGGALLRGHVTELAGSCVAVEVDELVSEGEPFFRADGSVLFDGTTEPGETLRGRLLTHYAYTHEFQMNESVAAIVERYDDTVALQLIPIVDGLVQLQWGTRRFSATLSELAAPDCQAQMSARYATAGDRGSATTSRTSTEPAKPAPPPTGCE